MKNELFREYYTEYLKIKRIIKEGSKPGRARKEAIENLYALYYDAQKEELPLSEVHEGTAEDFAAEILKSLPSREIVKRWQAAALAVTVLLAVEAVLYFTSDFYLEKKIGFAHALNNPERYEFMGYETIAVKKREDRGKRYDLRFAEGKTEILDGEDTFDYKSFENIEFLENGEKITLEVKIPFTTRNPNLKRVELPVNINSLNGEYGRVNCGHGLITLEAGESLYYGYLDYHRTEKNGDIYLGFVFLRQEGENAEEHILSGKTFTIDFDRIYSMNWARRTQSYINIKFLIVDVLENMELFPFFRFAEAETFDYPDKYVSEIVITKTSESGRFTVTAYLSTNLEEEKFNNIGYIDENNFEDTAEFEIGAEDFGITEGRKKAFVEISYRIEGSDEWLTERIEYTFDDIK